MQPRGFDPDDPKRKPDLRTPDRPFDPPPPEGPDEQTGALDDRSAVDRTTLAMGDQALTDALELDLLPPDLIPDDAPQPPADAPADAPASPPVRLTKKQRERIKATQQALSLRASGFSIPEIAEHMQVAPSTVTGWFTAHRRQVTDDQIEQQLDQVAVPLATENLIHGLLAGDKDYTLKVLEGRGKFKRHTDKGDSEHSGELPALVIRVEGNAAIGVGQPGAAPPALAPPTTAGHIVSTPAKRVQGRVVEEKDNDAQE